MIWLISIVTVIVFTGIFFSVLNVIASARAWFDRKVLAEARYIAIEHPELLGFTFRPKELGAAVTGPIEIVIVDAELVEDDLLPEITPLAEPEAGVAPIELGLRAVLEQTQAELEATREKAARAERLRRRYLAKVRRVDAAFREGGDLFPVLHPYLARMTA